jgi:hypothetical protein
MPVLIQASAWGLPKLATEKYIPLTPNLEGLVILKEYPEFRRQMW